MSRKLAFTLIAASVQFSVFGPAAHASCDPAHRGEAGCPDYTAPATTAVPGPSIDGSTLVVGGSPTTLFGGVVPTNGFMIGLPIPYDTSPGPWCNIRDNGPASSDKGFFVGAATGSGPLVFSVPTFVTPLGYKPMGPVSIFCENSSNSEIWIEARAW
jgi:hypothetical protein